MGVRGGLGEAPGALREAILGEKVVFGKCARRRGARCVPEGFGAPCGRSVLLRRRSGRATTPSERASWQGRSAKNQEISENASNFRIFQRKMQIFMKIATFGRRQISRIYSFAKVKL